MPTNSRLLAAICQYLDKVREKSCLGRLLFCVMQLVSQCSDFSSLMSRTRAGRALETVNQTETVTSYLRHTGNYTKIKRYVMQREYNYTYQLLDLIKK